METKKKHELPKNGLLEGRDDDFGIYLEWKAQHTPRQVKRPTRSTGGKKK